MSAIFSLSLFGDLLALLVLAVLFVAGIAYTHGCDRLKGPRP